ncbi:MULTISPECIES: hypothetical protein [Paenibacillus]|uniref:Uncharacterized protein n=1 Tax=Paenibacillus cucumis (ex Kampfer et al. 2016) TaxID=1776858 RepID=A0ABS7KLA0_9BACL|nr:hypothetical protein [Paenibacillus cucumis (ex Kampfer et al. 2016)]MBY0204717.1 hypothetical protein [Paenibacillus cucumis (ex Kampfer et al. 2016)]MDP9702377.1 hypothetical protein [Paenibacillus intestini]
MKKSSIISLMTSFILLGGVLLFPAPQANAAKGEFSTYWDFNDIPDEYWDDEDQTDESDADEESEEEQALIQARAELKTYFDQLSTLLSYEKKAVDSLHSIASEGNTASRKSIYLKLANTVVPNFTKLVSKAKLITSSNPEIKRLHTHLVRGHYLQLEGYILYKQAFSRNKVNLKTLQQGNAKVDAGRALVEQSTESLYNYAVEIGYESSSQ